MFKDEVHELRDVETLTLFYERRKFFRAFTSALCIGHRNAISYFFAHSNANHFFDSRTSY